LRKRQSLEGRRYPGNRVRRELSLLVAEIQLGSVVQLGEPNYALLSTAMRTIEAFIDSLDSEAFLGNMTDAPWLPRMQNGDEIPFHLSPDPWNFELSFWQDLAEHPYLDTEAYMREQGSEP
jgi:hypothetical protein